MLPKKFESYQKVVVVYMYRFLQKPGDTLKISIGQYFIISCNIREERGYMILYKYRTILIQRWCDTFQYCMTFLPKGCDTFQNCMCDTLLYHTMLIHGHPRKQEKPKYKKVENQVQNLHTRKYWIHKSRLGHSNTRVVIQKYS